MEYEKLAQDDDVSLQEHPPAFRSYRSDKSLLYRVLSFGCLISLLFSFSLNGFLLFHRSQVNHQQSSPVEAAEHGHAHEHGSHHSHEEMPPGRAPFDDDISPFAEVPRNVIKPLVEHTSYHNPSNFTAEHELWAAMDIDYAVVALDQDFIRQKNLPTAQPFPWDRSKGIYVLHGMHNLHCLKILYLSIKQFQNNEEQAIPWEHLSHCFDSIRQQLICDADDTLRASYAGQEGVSGIGQSRKCRNWDQYEQWAKNHTACYHRANKPNFDVPAIDHYKFCPEGSQYVIKNGTLTGE